jgi:hypothetical protein
MPLEQRSAWQAGLGDADTTARVMRSPTRRLRSLEFDGEHLAKAWRCPAMASQYLNRELMMIRH